MDYRDFGDENDGKQWKTKSKSKIARRNVELVLVDLVTVWVNGKVQARENGCEETYNSELSPV